MSQALEFRDYTLHVRVERHSLRRERARKRRIDNGQCDSVLGPALTVISRFEWMRMVELRIP